VSAKSLFHRLTAHSHMSQTAIQYLQPEHRVDHAATLDENGNEASSGAMWSPDHKWSLLRLADLRGQAATSVLAFIASRSGKQKMKPRKQSVELAELPCPRPPAASPPSRRLVTEYGQPARRLDSDHGSIGRDLGLGCGCRLVCHRPSPYAVPQWAFTLGRKPWGRG
jgi:hypothetical protein